MRVMTIVGTRPEIIRLSRVINELEERTEHTLVHTGQNYDFELSQIFFEDLGIRAPDFYLESQGGSPLETIGKIFAASYDLMLRERPEAVLVLGDTNSCLAAYSAKRLRIPVFHMEAGNRCFDERVPEEINRRLIDHMADINLPYSRHARELLLSEGCPPDRVIVTGSPMFEVLGHYDDRIRGSDVLERLSLVEDQYFVLSVHREENVDAPGGFDGFLSTLQRLWDEYGLPIIASTHPRTRKRLDELGGGGLSGDIRFLKPFSFSDYVKLQLRARAVLSDSGTITEEAAILGLRAVNLRQTHERHEGMEEAIVPMAEISASSVMQVLDLILSHGSGESWSMGVPESYSVPNVSKKVVRLIHSYVPYVRRNVWHGWAPRWDE